MLKNHDRGMQVKLYISSLRPGTGPM